MGCGGGREDTTTAQKDIQSGAQKHAEAIVLQLSDFPTGWRASPAEEGSGALSDCADIDFSDLTVNGKAESDDFAKGDVQEVSSEAAVFQSEQEARHALDDFGRSMERIDESCIRDAIQKSAQAGVQVGEVDVGELNFTPPPAADEARAWEMAIPVETQGLSPTFYSDFFILREGDAIAILITFDLSEPFDPALRSDLLDVMADRLPE